LQHSMITKFLIADDDEDDIELFEKALQAIDPFIEFDFAGDGKALIEKLQTGKVEPHVIFIDVNMPVMNGWECLHLLKRHEVLADIPVIIYSTSSSASYGKKAVSSGALGFYEKPTSFLDLKDFLELIIGSSPVTLKKTLEQIRTSDKHSFYTE
jgi:CheY-like chemotaxis protein